MNIEQVMKILISRNQKLVDKNGVTEYTQQTDSIINTLLNYIHETQKEINALKEQNQRMYVLLQLNGLEEYIDIDVEFLSRYLKYEIHTGLQDHLLKIGAIKEIELSMTDIFDSYNFFKQQLKNELDIFFMLKKFYPKMKELKTMYTEYAEYIDNGYSDEEVIKIIRNSLLYNNE